MTDLRDRLKQATTELYWVSETDASIDPVWFDDWQPDTLTADGLRDKLGVLDNTAIDVQPLDAATEPMTTPQPWHTEAEVQEVERFRDLVQLLHDSFRDVRAYFIGTVEVEVYVLGIAPAGWVGGVRSNLVRT